MLAMSTPSTLTWNALLAALRKTPERLREMAGEAGVNSAALPPAAPTDLHQWSVSQVIGHLCAIESPYRARLARIVLEDQPHVSVIGCITGDYDPATPLSILLDTFARLRADTVGFLRSLPVDARARPAVHAELGPITLRGQAEALLAHDEEHLVQVGALLGK